jgi:hypothetical protein
MTDSTPSVMDDPLQIIQDNNDVLIARVSEQISADWGVSVAQHGDDSYDHRKVGFP